MSLFSAVLKRPSTLGCALSFVPFVNPPVRPARSSQQASMASTNDPSSKSNQTAVFASGCFWGTEHIFREHFGNGKGLLGAKVGYTGGAVDNPSYRQVCTGSTQHAEAVKLEFDPSQVTYATLVEFFYRTHDASHLNHQGPDRGTQYRSAIFYLDDDQRAVAEQVTREVEAKHYAPKGKKIVTVIEKLQRWWDAEDYHQQYLHNNPGGYECPTHRLHW